MNEFKKKVIKTTIVGVTIFVVGLFIGYQINQTSLSAIQGYSLAEATDNNATDANATDANATSANATDANATSANATDANATSANATDANATSANATDANATSANATDNNATDANATDANASNIDVVSANDNIIFLQRFKLSQSNAKPGDKVNVEIETTGACNSATSIIFKSKTGATFTAQVQDITGASYIEIPNNALASTYSVTDVLLVGKNSNDTTFTKQFSINGNNQYDFDSKLVISLNEEKPESNSTTKPNETEKTVQTKVTMTNIDFDSSTAKLGEEVYITIKTSEKITGLKLVFTSTDKKTFVVNAKGFNEIKPYFEIPSTVLEGTYSLTSAIISTSNSSTAYSKNGENGTEKYNFNSSLEITSGDETTYVYNNEDINSEILTKLYSAPTGSEISVNAESNSFINEELFNAIKGQNKKLVINYNDNQIVFDGRNVNNSKTIDISMTVKDITSNEKINKLVSQGIIVNFPDNGNLPGKALIRIKANNTIKNLLNDKVYVYVYNEETNDFCVVDTNVTKTSDKYYEFTINHNSDYIIVNNKLDRKLLYSETDNNIVSFQKSNVIYLLLIVVGVVIAISTAVVIVVLKKNKAQD